MEQEKADLATRLVCRLDSDIGPRLMRRLRLPLPPRFEQSFACGTVTELGQELRHLRVVGFGSLVNRSLRPAMMSCKTHPFSGGVTPRFRQDLVRHPGKRGDVRVKLLHYRG